MNVVEIYALVLVVWGLTSLCFFALLREVRHSNTEGSKKWYKGNERVSTALYHMSAVAPFGLLALLFYWSAMLVSGDDLREWLNWGAVLIVFGCYSCMFLAVVFNVGVSEFKARATVRLAERDE